MTAGDVAVPAGFLGLLWFVVFLAITAAWSVDARRPVFGSLSAAIGYVDGRVLAAAAALVAWALHRLVAVARGPVTPDRGLEQPVLVRALCVTAFVLFAPRAFALFRTLGVSEPVGVALAYGLSEAYPFLATLIDRGLDRAWPSRSPVASGSGK